MRYNFDVRRTNADGEWFSLSLYELEGEFGRRFNDHGSGMGGEDGGFSDVRPEEIEHLINVCKKHKLKYTIFVYEDDDDYEPVTYTSSLFKHSLIAKETRGQLMKSKRKSYRYYYWKSAISLSWRKFLGDLKWLCSKGDERINWQTMKLQEG